MSTFKTPVGPQPSRVYWRRRLMVGLGLLAVVLIVVLILVKPAGGKAAPHAKPAASATPKPAATTAAGAVCKPASVSVEAVTDAETYAAGINPKLSLILTNNGTTDCTFKVGTDVQVYTITSGTEKIWSSKDCQTNPAPLTVTLKAGVPLTSAKNPIEWDRTRSDPTTCKKDRPKVIAGGASYHLAVSVNAVTSAKTKQFILK